MRDILFRGKDKKSKEWIEGNFLPYALIIRFQNSDPEGYEFNDVFRETVSEFTGLYDKNGKRVFEGDIVKVNLIGGGERISEVGIGECFDTDGETVFGVFGKSDEGNLIIPISEEYVALYEVIGNKWDNPELLKKEN